MQNKDRCREPAYGQQQEVKAKGDRMNREVGIYIYLYIYIYIHTHTAMNTIDN